MPWTALALAAAFPAACGQGAKAGRGSVTVTDSAGVEIVQNDSVGRLGHLESREVLRLGTFEGEGPEMFDQVYAVALDSAGRIYVGNNGTGSVRVFGPDGAFQAEFGGRGQGPSEVSMVNDLFVVGDTVVVTDWQRGGKQVLFRPDGTFLTSWRLREPDARRPMLLARAAEGWLGTVEQSSRPSDLAEGEAWEVKRDLHVVADPAAGEPGRLVQSLPSMTLYDMGGEGEGSLDWALFRPTWSTGFDGEGRVYLVRPEAYRIDVYGARGGLRRSVRRAFRPRPLTDEDVAEVKARALQVIDTLGGDRISPASRARQHASLSERIDRQARLPLPAIAAPIDDILVSRDGSFWVRHRITSPAEVEARAMFGGVGFGGVPPEPTEWGLFDPEGAYLGTVRLPARFRADAVQGREVAGVWRDELDVEYVLRLEAHGRFDLEDAGASPASASWHPAPVLHLTTLRPLQREDTRRGAPPCASGGHRPERTHRVPEAPETRAPPPIPNDPQGPHRRRASILAPSFDGPLRTPARKPPHRSRPRRGRCPRAAPARTRLPPRSPA